MFYKIYNSYEIETKMSHFIDLIRRPDAQQQLNEAPCMARHAIKRGCDIVAVPHHSHPNCAKNENDRFHDN